MLGPFKGVIKTNPGLLIKKNKRKYATTNRNLI